MPQAADLTLRLNAADDVVIARVEIPEGTTLLKEHGVRVSARVPAGHKVAAPSLKLATNTRLFQHQEGDMDLNCGTIVDGKESIVQVGQKLFGLILETASGRRTKSEAFGYGEEEFAPWVLGATM